MQIGLINYINFCLVNSQPKEEINFEVVEDDLLKVSNNKNSLILYIDSGTIYDENDNELGHISELEYYPKFNQLNECQDCYGERFVEIGPICNMPASMCCGGCYQKVECDCENKLFNDL